MSEQERRAWHELAKDLRKTEERLFFGPPFPEPSLDTVYRRELKLAIVQKPSGKQKVVFRHMGTGEQYLRYVDGHYVDADVDDLDAVRIEPEFPFVRWARLMDL